MQISNLRDVENFATIIADRGWHEWWANTDIPLSEHRAGIKQMGLQSGIPTAIVAHRNSQYLGSVLLIENDLAARAQYSPWIAALWVEPEFRSQCIAGKLIEAARDEASRHGYQACYLCATELNSPYYMARCFVLVEHDVGGVDIFITEDNYKS